MFIISFHNYLSKREFARVLIASTINVRNLSNLLSSVNPLETVETELHFKISIKHTWKLTCICDHYSVLWLGSLWLSTPSIKSVLQFHNWSNLMFFLSMCWLLYKSIQVYFGILRSWSVGGPYIPFSRPAPLYSCTPICEVVRFLTEKGRIWRKRVNRGVSSLRLNVKTGGYVRKPVFFKGKFYTFKVK
jgi:hypothetical protein